MRGGVRVGGGSCFRGFYTQVMHTELQVLCFVSCWVTGDAQMILPHLGEPREQEDCPKDRRFLMVMRAMGKRRRA